jgi:hypothetical protein
MILRFGTSPSNTYGLGKDISSKVDGWLKNPYALVIEVVGKIKDTLTGIKETLTTEIDEDFKDKHDQLWGMGEYADQKKDGDAQQKAQDRALWDVKKLGLKFVDFIESFISTALLGLAKKYRVEILGIVNALSGLPSTPWHITIGNPLRPVFCAGDMYTTSVKIALGPNLAFNDLPASIKVSFSLANARPWGLQEIMSKFNSGYLRTVDVQKSFYEINTNEAVGQFDFEANPPAPDSGTASSPLGGSQSTPIPGSTQSSTVAKNTNSGSSTKATDGQVPKKV